MNCSSALVAFPGVLLFLGLERIDSFEALRREGKTAAADPHIVSLDEVYRLEGVDAFQAEEKKYGSGSEAA